MRYYLRISLAVIIALIGTVEIVESTKRRLRPSHHVSTTTEIVEKAIDSRTRGFDSTYLVLGTEWDERDSDTFINERYTSNLESHSTIRTIRKLPATGTHENVFARKGYKSKKSGGKGSNKKTSKKSKKSTGAPTLAPLPKTTSTPTIPPPTLTPTSSPTPIPTPELTGEPTCPPHTPGPTRTHKDRTGKKSSKRAKRGKRSKNKKKPEKSTNQPSAPPSPTLPSPPTPTPPSPTLPTPTPPSPTLPTPTPPSPTPPTPDPPSPIPPTPTAPPPTPPPTPIPQPTISPAPTLMPVPTTPKPTRMPATGPAFAATPFCAEYSGTSRTASDANTVAAAQETCLHISEYIIASFELNIQNSVAGINCDQSQSSAGPPAQICFDLEVMLDPGLSNTPSQDDIDVLIAVSLQEPSVQDLYDRLAALPASNPFSETTLVTEVAGPLTVDIVRGQTENTVLSSTFVLLGLFAAVLFHRCVKFPRNLLKSPYRSHEISDEPWSVLERDCHVLFSIDENGEEEKFGSLNRLNDSRLI